MSDETKEMKSMTTVERYETVADGGEVAGKAHQRPEAMGTVTITDMEDIFLVPAPSADPRGASISFRVEAAILTHGLRPTEHVKMEENCIYNSGFYM